ncbi:uncharacterized protein V6R79_012777 [Siganus canaliculatus]
MPAMRSRDCNNETALKKGGKEHLQSEHSGVYTKNKVSIHPSATVATEPPLSPPASAFLPLTQEFSETSRSKSLVCLKDLCPEDKRRIANLIEELARVSEEKEESVQRLKDEQEHFERKIQQLEQQNVMIAHERESLQQQYRECQELLGLYQQYLTQQQAKLNQSIAQLSQERAHTKVLINEEDQHKQSRSRSNGSLFDGSYLGIATTASRAQPPQVRDNSGGGRAAVQTLSNSASLSCVTEFSPTDESTWNQKREYREPHSESHHRWKRCQVCGQDSGYETRRRRGDNSSRLDEGHQDSFNQHQCERVHCETAIGLEAKETLTRPLLGHEDWEEKRHQLLLQKMQLEAERERLQARLVEQEERLTRQSQQLRQSRLDYSRFQQAAQCDGSISDARNGDPQPQGPTHQELPSSVHEDAGEHPAGQSLHEKQSHTVAAPLDNGIESLERSRLDMVTSPAGRSKPPSTSQIQKTPEARLDFSVAEVLDIFSPVTAPVLNKTSTRRTKASHCGPTLAVPKSAGRALVTPARPYPQLNQQDLEESQILEDIFFIC